MNIPRKVWVDAIGVGLFTLVYSLIMSGFSLWMGSAAFIAVSYFFGAGFPKDKLWNILLSFALGLFGTGGLPVASRLLDCFPVGQCNHVWSHDLRCSVPSRHRHEVYRCSSLADCLGNYDADYFQCDDS